MAALPLLARGRRGALRAHEPEEPERYPLAMGQELVSQIIDDCSLFSILASKSATQKRACKPLEAVPNEADARLTECAMELESKQKISTDVGPWAAKAKQNSVIFENHGNRGTAQPCPRCIAGESGHFNHILGF